MGRENEQGKGVRDEGICRRDEKSGREAGGGEVGGEEGGKRDEG